MKILHRHLRHTVITVTALVSVVVLGLLIFIGVINEIRDIGVGRYGTWQAFVYVLTSLPQDFYPLFPAVALIGCLMGLGRLATDSELIVMRAAGVSKVQISFSVIRSAILMLVFITAFGEWAAPLLKNNAIQYKAQARANHQDVSFQQTKGAWIRDKTYFLHIEEITPEGHLKNIMAYQFSGQKLLSASHADSGQPINGKWLFNNVHTSQFEPDQILVKHFPQQIWAVSFDPKLITALNMNTTQTTLPKLYGYIRYLDSNGLSSSAYAFNFWKRAFQPLATLVMIGLGIPFIFGQLRNMTMGLRILIGVIIGFVFYTFNEFLGPFSLVYQVPPLWAALTPILLFAGVDVILWRKTR